MRPLMIVFAAAFVAAFAHGAERGRARIMNNTVVADNGVRLRGDVMAVVPGYGIEEILNRNRWREFRDNSHLNLVRLLVYRNPWGKFPDGHGGYERLNWPCEWYGSACMSVDSILPMLDSAVAVAAQQRMYAMIVFNSSSNPDTTDCIAFWRVVAPRYANRTHVLYEMVTEPVAAFAGETYDATQIAFQNRLFRFVRALAPRTLLLTHSFMAASVDMKTIVDQTVAQLGGIDYANAAVSYHWYDGNNNQIMRLKGAYPVFFSEWGPQNGRGFPACHDLMVWHEQQGISWSALHQYPSIEPSPTSCSIPSEWCGRWPAWWGADTVTIDSLSSLTFSVNEGWNLVSVPCVPPDFSPSVLFPTAVSRSIYAYVSGTYVHPVVLQNGEGYWTFYRSPGTNTTLGTPLTNFTLNIPTGNRWVAVGSIGLTVPATALVSSPPDAIVASRLYTWNGTTYVRPTSIEPGKGYWVFVNSPCVLTISPGSGQSGITPPSSISSMGVRRGIAPGKKIIFEESEPAKK